MIVNMFFKFSFENRFRWWLPALSYVFFLLICDELRKYIIRKHPGGVVERETSN
jgi:hypothetical protein